jgi:hypothetical protein
VNPEGLFHATIRNFADFSDPDSHAC